MTTRQLCTFVLDDLLLGVDVSDVQEVIRWQPMTLVPLAPPAVLGLINLRGDIVTAIDLRVRMGLPRLESDQQPGNVVIRDGDSTVALVVDEIGDVLEVDDDDFEPPPPTMHGPAREVVAGAYKLSGHRLLLLLDTTRACDCTLASI